MARLLVTGKVWMASGWAIPADWALRGGKATG
jgi:hypothetical protein